MAVPKKSAPAKPSNAARNRLIVIIGLLVLTCVFVGIAATSHQFEANQRWILIVAAIVLAVGGLVLSAFTVLRQTKDGDGRETGWKTSPTENQRRRLNENLHEIVRALENPEVQPDDLFSAYLVAEDLALRQVQQESRENLLRHQSIGGVDFDAILPKPDVTTCIETAFLVVPDVPQSKINDILGRITAAKTSFERSGKPAKLRLLFVLITQLDKEGEARLRSSLVEKFSATAVDVDIRLFEFEELQQIYAP